MSVTLSVIVPAYNVATYVEETLRAVVAQSFSDWELIVMENASTDGTMEVLDSVLRDLNDPRIRVLRNSNTLPPAVSWNYALSQTRGEFLKLVCADDLPAVDAFKRQVLAMQSNPSVVLATGTKIIIDAQGRVLFTRRTIKTAGVHSGPEVIRNCILAGTNIIGDPVHVMWRRTAMDRAGMFDVHTPYATDVEFWFRMLEYGDLYWELNPVGYYRIHGKAASVDQWQATARCFLQMAREQVRRGVVSLSNWELNRASLRAYAQGVIRQVFYTFSG